VQFIPQNMTVEEMQRGYYLILEKLFGPGQMYRRASSLLDRLNPHIFRGRNLRKSDMRAAFRSLWIQGVLKRRRLGYYRLLTKAAWLDFARSHSARRAANRIDRRLRKLSQEARASLAERDVAWLASLVDRAREAAVRAQPSRKLDEVSEWAARMTEQIEQRTPTTEDLRALYHGSQEFFVRRRRAHRFPGVYLTKAFELAIKGLHYEIVMYGITRGEGLHNQVGPSSTVRSG
jgi:hypothetical protein